MVHPFVRRSWRSLAIALLFLAAALAVPPTLTRNAAAAGTAYLSGDACGGNPTATWTNTTAYVLIGNVTVPVGCTLTIQPGTAIRADPQVRLYVNGVLEANGTATESISFDTNVTNQAWGGVQFNKTSKASYLSYASLDMVDHAVRAVGTPLFWGPFLSNLNIDHAVVGVEFQGANATLHSSRINYTTMAVHAADGGYGGYPIIVANTITTVISNPAIAIYATNLVQPTIQSNWITWVNGTDGANGGGIFTAGQDGAGAIGILVIGGSSPIVAGNTVSQVRGGRGGAGGSPILPGNGGRGGKGGDAIGIAMGNAVNTRAQTNDITGIAGGHGGNGGAANGFNTGGVGGAGGSAIAVEAVNSTTTGWWFYNDAIGISGGSAGDGGSGAAQGTGGSGGAAYGHFFLQNAAGNASNNLAKNLLGGYGGNGSVGGVGGDVGGLWMARIIGSAILGSNQVTGITGGIGGAGNQPVARGGNATAILALGDDRYFNATTIRDNTIDGVTGGIGGVGGNGGSNGGSATGIGAIFARLVSLRNSIQAIAGGQGGSTAPGKTNGQGGTATGYAVGGNPSSASSLDKIQSITRGLPGSGGNNPTPAQGIGFYVAGNATFTPLSTLTNDTFASVGDADLFLGNYTRTTALNVTFSSAKPYVSPAANLTVQNFLAVRALWPNNVSQVWGTRVVVKDNGVEAYNRTSPLGYTRWIVVTNRVYIDSPVATWNTTQVVVSYQTYTFLSNPRSVNLTASQTLTFVMADTTPPTSNAAALPAYETTRSFGVWYTYGDGLGVGVANITLWYRLNGTLWVDYGLQAGSVLPIGMFSFTASTDGTFEFATTAIDKVGNAQLPRPPTANTTWTIVDTTKPGSHVGPLPTYETSLSFPVSWAANSGTTDVARYTIQYNSTAGWVTWLNASAPSSATFNATSQGVYQFRSIATDRAGNVEIKTTNDTWTVVDSILPTSAVSALPAYETAAAFTVTWGPTAGTTDIENYTVQVSEDGGPWTDWLTETTATSASFLGTDGHSYAFRSVARDTAGNVEAKTGNDTWTIVDTTPPSSAVAGLPTYETSLSFLVSWAPAPGTLDVASYRVEYNGGSGWVTWYSDTVLTSAMFTATGQGLYQFRSLATDRAGNLEAKTGNDTWTIVDSVVPTSRVAALPTYETTATFTISWGPTGTTTDVRAFTLEVSEDGATWATWVSGATNRSATFTGVDGHRYAFRSLATDYAGNAEAKTGNDTWTAVDTSAPASSIGALPRYENVVTFPVSWGPSTGTADVATYEIQMSRDGGTWTAWLSGVTNRSAVFTGVDGHTYAFRSLATDYAGNAEAKTGNDTFTSIDASSPTILLAAPEGAGVAGNTTVTVTFSEPMNEASVEQSFSLSPTVDGSFSWNAAGTVLTFTPSRPLAAGTQYTVVVATGARDLAGNGMASIRTFAFTTTAASAGPVGASFLDWWPLLVLVAVAAAVVLVLLMRRRGAQASEIAPKVPPAASGERSSAAIDDVFLLYRKDGILIKHETRRLRPDIDSDILSGMLNAVQAFVKDSLLGTEGDELSEMVLGQMHILIGRGKWLILAATITGGDMASMNTQIQRCIQDMEDHNWDRLDDWNGDMDLAKVLASYLKKLIRGEYAA